MSAFAGGLGGKVRLCSGRRDQGKKIPSRHGSRKGGMKKGLIDQELEDTLKSLMTAWQLSCWVSVSVYSASLTLQVAEPMPLEIFWGLYRTTRASRLLVVSPSLDDQ